MATKTVEIILKAKNALAAGLRSAGNALKKFGGGAAAIGKAFAKGFLVAGTAIAGLSVKLLQAFGVQEKAEKQAEAAFRAYGEEVKQNTQAVKNFAAAIQNETGIADESTIARAATLKLLGVQTDKLEAAAKATIALQKAGMGEQTAMKAVAAAIEGNFEALTRYIPALRTATSDAEKAAIVNDFVTKGYAAQKDELNTVTGRWNEFKGRVGDVLEQLGGLIAKDAGVTGMLKRAADGVKALGDRIAQWVAAGGMGRLIATVQLFAENFRSSFAKIAIIASGVFKGSILDPGKRVVQLLTSQFSALGMTMLNVFRFVGEAAKAAWEKVKSPAKEFKAPDMGPLKQSIKDLGRALKGEFVDVPNSFEEMYAKLAAESERHAAKVKAISDKQISDYKEAAEERVAVEKKTQDEIVIAAENTAQKKEDLRKREMRLAQQVADAERNAQREALREHINNLEEAERKRAALAKKTVDQILEEQRARANADKEWARAETKARRLRDRQGRGVKLSRKQQEWLDAFTKIEQAKAGAVGANPALQNAKDQLKALNDQGPKLDAIKGELVQTRQDLNALLMRK